MYVLIANRSSTVFTIIVHERNVNRSFDVLFRSLFVDQFDICSLHVVNVALRAVFLRISRCKDTNSTKLCR